MNYPNAIIEKVLVLVLILGIPTSLLAETFPSLRFEKPVLDNKEYNEAVTSLAIDKKGFLWFSTLNGLVRFDGYSSKRFLHSKEQSNSLSSNQTSAILADSNGILWIGTENKGLNRFDPRTEQFTHYWPADLEPSKVLHIYQDSLGTIWVSTLSSGDLFKRRMEKVYS